RPDFFHAMRPDEANRLYEKFIDRLSERYTVRHGEFGADMKVSLINDGPVTIVIDTDDLKKPRSRQS
nr:D-aminoacyl-tRNA deacylase [Clostridiales bacterium]